MKELTVIEVDNDEFSDEEEFQSFLESEKDLLPQSIIMEVVLKGGGVYHGMPEQNNFCFSRWICIIETGD